MRMQAQYGGMAWTFEVADNAGDDLLIERLRDSYAHETGEVLDVADVTFAWEADFFIGQNDEGDTCVVVERERPKVPRFLKIAIGPNARHVSAQLVEQVTEHFGVLPAHVERSMALVLVVYEDTTDAMAHAFDKGLAMFVRGFCAAGGVAGVVLEGEG